MSEIFTGHVLNEADTVYHSKRDYVSSSPLPEMNKSPLHFYNAWTTSTEATDPMERGNFMHKIILEQDISKYVARPVKPDGDLVRSNSKEYAAFLSMNEGKTPIGPDLFNEAFSILTAATSNKTFLRALTNSFIETSFYAVHEPTGLPIKARPDILATDYSFLFDVKSTADIQKFEKQIFSLQYDVRLVHYAETIKALTGKEVKDIYFGAIESKAPFGTRVYRLSDSAREAAFIQWDMWMNEISVCQKEAKWPGFDEEIVEVNRPRWMSAEETVSFEGVS